MFIVQPVNYNWNCSVKCLAWSVPDVWILVILADLMSVDDLILNHSGLTFPSLIFKNTGNCCGTKPVKKKCCLYIEWTLNTYQQVDNYKIF